MNAHLTRISGHAETWLHENRATVPHVRLGRRLFMTDDQLAALPARLVPSGDSGGGRGTAEADGGAA